MDEAALLLAIEVALVARAAVLVGPAGSGKSRLARRLTDRVAATSNAKLGRLAGPSFHDGAPATSEDEGLLVLASDLHVGIRTDPQRPNDEREARLLGPIAEALEALDLPLVILDNWDFPGAPQVLADLLTATSRARFFVTRREPLELPSATVARSFALPPSAAPAPDAAFRSAYEALDEAAQRAFRFLALLPSGASEFFGAVRDWQVSPGGDPAELLPSRAAYETLEARGLVVVIDSPSMYSPRRWLLPTWARSFAMQELKARPDELRAAERARSHGAAWAAEAFTERSRTSEFFLEMFNILRAAESAEATFWLVHNLIDGLRNYGEEGYDDEPIAFAPPALLHGVCERAAGLARSSYERHIAAEDLAAALAALGRAEDAEAQLLVSLEMEAIDRANEDLDRRATVAHGRKDFSTEEALLRELQAADPEGRDFARSLLQQRLATCLSHQGRHDEALALVARELNEARRSSVLELAAHVLCRAGRPSEALMMAREAVVVLPPLAGKNDRAQVHVVVADMALACGDRGASDLAYGEALLALRGDEGATLARLVSWDRIGASPRQAFDVVAKRASGYGALAWPGGMLAAVAALLVDTGRVGEAVPVYDAALELLDAHEARCGQKDLAARGYLLVGFGAALLAVDPARAEKVLVEAIEAVHGLPDGPGAGTLDGTARLNLANLRLDAGRLDEAEALFDEASRRSRPHSLEISAKVTVCRTLLTLARGDCARAREEVAAAREQLTDPRWRGIATLSRGFAELCSRDFDRAAATLAAAAEELRAAGDENGAARAVCFAVVARSRSAMSGEGEDAARLTAAEAVFRRIGDPHGLCIASACRSYLAHAEGETREPPKPDDGSTPIDVSLLHTFLGAPRVA